MTGLRSSKSSQILNLSNARVENYLFGRFQKLRRNLGVGYLPARHAENDQRRATESTRRVI